MCYRIAVQFLMHLSMLTSLLLFKMNYRWIRYLYLSNFYVKIEVLLYLQ